jgi:hypothetical protein
MRLVLRRVGAGKYPAGMKMSATIFATTQAFHGLFAEARSLSNNSLRNTLRRSLGAVAKW